MRSPSKPVKLLVAGVVAAAGLVASVSSAAATPQPKDTAGATFQAHGWHCGTTDKGEHVCWLS